MTHYRDEDVIDILEGVIEMSERSSLETGFNHSPVTLQELRERLSRIQNYCQCHINEIMTQGLT